MYKRGNRQHITVGSVLTDSDEISKVDIICFYILFTALIVGLILKGIGIYKQWQSVTLTPPTMIGDFSAVKSNKTDTVIKSNKVDTIESVTELDEELIYMTGDIDLLARVTMSEASVLSYIEKKAVVEVILNRVDYESYPNTITDVVYQDAQFSVGDNGAPTEECYQAVYDALAYRSFPTDMLWFREDYAEYGHEYLHMPESNMVFSTVNKY